MNVEILTYPLYPNQTEKKYFRTDGIVIELGKNKQTKLSHRMSHVHRLLMGPYEKNKIMSISIVPRKLIKKEDLYILRIFI